MASITCGNCKNTHHSAAAVRACHTGNLFPCHWGVEDADEDGQFIRDCAAEAIATERGWTCAAGHEHVTMEARHAERWDYAEDGVEAGRMAMHGMGAVHMDGTPFADRELVHA